MEDHNEEHIDDESGSSPTATSPEMEDSASLPSTSSLSPVAAAPTSPTSPTSPTFLASAPSSSSQSMSSSHSSTSRPLSKLATARPSPHYTRPTSPAPAIQPRLRTRGLGLTPLTSTTGNTCHPLAPLGTGNLPKSQPLARALFAKMASGHDTPHAGMGGKKKSGGQKLVVPTKGFKTRFELSLSSSELARQ